MFRGLTAAAMLMAGCGIICLADEPPVRPAVQPEKALPAPPAQPRVAPAQPGFGAQPAPFRTTSPTVLARYEEEAAVLDAQLDRISKLAANKSVSVEEVDMAKVDLEAAAAQLDIRKAEMKEVEVKLKYAKKRLDDAKNAPVRGTTVRPAVDPKLADPPFRRRSPSDIH